MAAVSLFFYIFLFDIIPTGPNFLHFYMHNYTAPCSKMESNVHATASIRHIKTSVAFSSPKSRFRYVLRTGLQWVSGPPHFIPSTLAQDTPITSLTVSGNKLSQGIPYNLLTNQSGSRKSPLPNAPCGESHKCGNPM